MEKFSERHKTKIAVYLRVRDMLPRKAVVGKDCGRSSRWGQAGEGRRSLAPLEQRLCEGGGKGVMCGEVTGAPGGRHRGGG